MWLIPHRGYVAITTNAIHEIRQYLVWTPHQRRPTRSRLICKRYGIEAAQVILGHSKADTTEIYAERDLGKAKAIIARIG